MKTKQWQKDKQRWGNEQCGFHCLAARTYSTVTQNKRGQSCLLAMTVSLTCTRYRCLTETRLEDVYQQFVNNWTILKGSCIVVVYLCVKCGENMQCSVVPCLFLPGFSQRQQRNWFWPTLCEAPPTRDSQTPSREQ